MDHASALEVNASTCRALRQRRGAKQRIEDKSAHDRTRHGGIALLDIATPSSFRPRHLEQATIDMNTATRQLFASRFPCEPKHATAPTSAAIATKVARRTHDKLTTPSSRI